MEDKKIAAIVNTLPLKQLLIDKTVVGLIPAHSPSMITGSSCPSRMCLTTMEAPSWCECRIPWNIFTPVLGNS